MFSGDVGGRVASVFSFNTEQFLKKFDIRFNFYYIKFSSEILTKIHAQ